MTGVSKEMNRGGDSDGDALVVVVLVVVGIIVDMVVAGAAGDGSVVFGAAAGDSGSDTVGSDGDVAVGVDSTADDEA